jgi:serine/threonine protein phosphatase PrpC
LEISDKEKWISGSTVVLAVLWDKKLVVANCGDSEAVIGKRRTNPFTFEDGTSSWHEPLVLSKKHKPNDPDEKERIKKAGGHVVFGRVMGSLAVARAVGDREFKYPFNHGEADFVSAVPWIQSIDINPGQEEFLILSCDGLWDKMTYERAIHFVSRHRHEFNKELAETVKLLGQHSIERGSLDNVTATLVYFPASKTSPLLPLPSSSSNKSEVEVQETPKVVKAVIDNTSDNTKGDDDEDDEGIYNIYIYLYLTYS